ncbi:MAG: PIG-L family deacetylase [Candidatus Omnitrophica bacterium]|nr:PIG-L family deacetylase [Candidatus Omnitrophota bacterium]
MKNLREFFPSRERILILSPHPDDDCIGMGATINFLKKKDNIIKIFYLTPGWRGVKENLSCKERINLRKNEAISASKILGIDKKSLKFLFLPFYEKGKVVSEDIQKLTKEIKKFHPLVIFTSGEENDPHLTHKKCWKIIKESLDGLDFFPKVYIYRVWKLLKKFDFYFPFGDEIMELKIEAIKAHRSQLEPKYIKKGMISFWEREESLNKFYGEVLRKKGKIRNFLFAEVFKSCPNNPEKNRGFRDEE